jgi:hypothetical protein
VSLKAIVDGETIIGPDLSKEEWTKLKLRHRNGLPIKIGCCGAPGHLRISKKGTQHLIHIIDPHLGVATFNRLDPESGMNLREKQVYDNFLKSDR